ncbi:polysaccharide export protein [Aliiglaciecola sp. 2_MG-2023]|uniref:XrtA/PEP-CTERM system exopolysaccharide export protein n=1 Tax=unclassified Aliiglaciecola TaxID=2593648 RepID=UPI0026E4612F|nr:MULTISPECIES: XrtA/PEP-CTERM system exopolysaccharide export protein [unclassified Aliiglaciecola]MDO6709174.1 polysaccharide export protein [Aliiglaciecola sp. 2_MG-2023]MDO6750322.1 polysaccharide export protein [Aliiglaciecola sp. 1_MG-2023]
MKASRIAQLLIAAAAFTAINACTSSGSSLPQATTRASLTTNIDDYSYLIGPGDNLSIFVWRNPDVSGSFLVRPDGMITTSLVEDIPVSGKTPTALARDLEQELGKYIRDPIVTVSVSGFNGPFSEQVRVIGEASSPRAISYSEDMTLLDLMIQVGGLTEFADGDGAKLIRVVNGEQKEFSVKLDSLVKEGNISDNVDILPGDILIIPEAWF